MQVSRIMTLGPVTVAPDAKLDEVLRTMDEKHFRHLPVLDGGELVGIVSDRDLLQATGWLPVRVHACRGPDAGDKLPHQVGQIMQREVTSIGPDDTITSATFQLLRHGIGCLPVIGDGRLIGMLTDTDLLEAYASGLLDLRVPRLADPLVRQCMTSAPVIVRMDTTLGEAISLCYSHGVRHLPVVDAAQLVGIVSDRDLRRAVGVGRPEDMLISKIVKLEPVQVTPKSTLAQAARLMLEQRFSSLPVVDEYELVGILTLTDVLDHCLEACRESDEARGPML